MIVYNIRKEKYAQNLVASGIANRWNKESEYVIYTAGSRALAALELVVHKNAIALDTNYITLAIELRISEKDIETVDLKNLPENWKSLECYPKLQKTGSVWYQKREKLALRVPSAIIPQEFNYLINTQHPDFIKRVSIAEREYFLWDKRLF